MPDLDLPDVCWGCRQHPHGLLYNIIQVGQTEEITRPAPWLQPVQLLSQLLLLAPVVGQEVEAEDDAVRGGVHSTEQELSGNRGDHFGGISSQLQIPHEAHTSPILIKGILDMYVRQTLERSVGFTEIIKVFGGKSLPEP